MTVSFGPSQMQSYFQDLRTVSEAVDRIAFCPGLERAHLL